MRGIDNEYIKNAIDALVDSLGVKEDIPLEAVLPPLRMGKTNACIESIADYLGLPVIVNLIISDRFETSALATASSDDQGIQGISAQVSIPSHLPFYGTPSVSKTPIHVQVGGNYQGRPHAFISVMAHELCHLVLHSLWHTEKNNEIYTDLTAMILGFSAVMQAGRRVIHTQDCGAFTQTATTTYGYLADEQFHFALNRINGILKEKRTRCDDLKRRITQTMASYDKEVHLYRKLLRELNKLIEYVDNNPTRKIKKNDVPKVVEVHGPNYVERFASVLRDHEKKLEEVQSLYSDRCNRSQHHYTAHVLDSLRAVYADSAAALSALGRESSGLKDDVVVLRRCASVLCRLKIRRQVGSET